MNPCPFINVRPSSLLLILFFTQLDGCVQESWTEEALVRDSAGVRIVESRRPIWGEGEGWTVDPEPSLEIGARVGDEHFEFFQVTDVLRLPDGRVIVLDSGSRTARFFSPTGDFLFEIGGPGQGPAEFGSLGSICRLGGDTLAIVDGSFSKAVYFTTDGYFIRSVHLRRKGIERPMGLLPLSDQRLVLFTFGSPLASDQEPEEGIHRLMTPAFLFSRDGGFVDTLGIFPGTEQQLIRSGSRTTFGPAPFARTTVFAVRDSLIYVGTGDRMEVSVLRPDGSLKEVFRNPSEDLSLREEDREEYRRHLVSLVTTEEEREFAQHYTSELVFPDTRPAFEGIEMDVLGHVWLRAYYPPPGFSDHWTVFDPERRLLGRIRVPEGLRVLEIDAEFILGVWTDDLGVEYVRAHRLQR